MSSDTQKISAKSMDVLIDIPSIGVNEDGSVFTVVVDSCEYIYFGVAHNQWGSHKGNCKYCAARAAIKDSIRNAALVDSILSRGMASYTHNKK